ncbi:hypothetical protein K469DRAFT_514097, partial [Zopfia rhizophila CBS 207.26]
VPETICIALKHLRSSAGTRTLWINAICINLEEVSERSERIKRMGDIYTFAHRVVVWFCPRSKDS